MDEMGDKKVICTILTDWILREQAVVNGESEHPHVNPDVMDDILRNGRERVAKLREIRKMIEEL